MESDVGDGLGSIRSHYHPYLERCWLVASDGGDGLGSVQSHYHPYLDR